MPASDAQTCPECGAVWDEGQTCRDHYGVLLAREYADPVAGAVHHLTVMCFNLQHPAEFTDEAIAWYRATLEAVLERGLSPAELRSMTRHTIDQSKRTWKVTRRTPVAPRHVDWPMTVVDAAQGDPEAHCERITRWAWSILAALRARERGTE